MKRCIYYFVGIIFIFSCQDQKKDRLKVNPDLRDSILTYLKEFDNNISKEENLNKSFQFVQQIENDSLQIKYLKTIDYRALNSNSRYYLKINELGRHLSRKYADTISLANFYWNLGDSYLNENKTDFAYYAFNEAAFLYNQKNDLEN